MQLSSFAGWGQASENLSLLLQETPGGGGAGRSSAEISQRGKRELEFGFTQRVAR